MLVTQADFQAALQDIANSEMLAIDLETTGLQRWGPHRDRICGVAVRTPRTGYYFPFRHKEGDNLPLEQLPALIEATYHAPVWRGHNWSFDIAFMVQAGWDFPVHPVRLEDTMVLIHLLNENEPSLKLKELGAKYIDSNAQAQERELQAALGKRGGLNKGDMWQLPAVLVESYAVQDVDLTWALAELAHQYLAKRYFHDLGLQVNAYNHLIIRLMLYGVQLDVPLIEQYMAECEEQHTVTEARIQALAGYELNPRSAKQVQAWLGVQSSAADVLETMPDHPGAQLMLTYRAWHRALTSYYRRFLEEMDGQHILHPNLNVTGTVSSRLSCNSPNLQALPVRTEVYKVKDVIVARPGYGLIAIDYQQAEVRVGAHYARETGLIRALEQGLDPHSATAEQLGLPRHFAKRINFGMVYGMGAGPLANDLHISYKEAQALLGQHRGAYPGFRDLYHRAQRIAQTRGYIQLYTGRRRHYNDRKRAPAHKAMSNLIQGTVAEIMREDMMRIDQELCDDHTHLLLQVHDDFLIETPLDGIHEVAAAVEEIMLDVPSWISAPMAVDVKIGTRLGEMLDD